MVTLLLPSQDYPEFPLASTTLAYLGKGRQDSCDCELPGSIECVRFHIAGKRLRAKLELGSAFYYWKLEKMGEEVNLSWTKEQENRVH